MAEPGQYRVPDVGQVEQQLAELWRAASSEGEAVVRACTLNLVIACAGNRDLTEVTGVVAGLTELRPGRALVMSADEEAIGEPSLDVYVSTHCHRGAGGAQVCSEQVTLDAVGEGCSLLPGTVLQLLVGDLPVLTWWRKPRLSDDALFRQIVELSDRFVLDSATYSDPAAALAALASLASDRSWKGTAGDLAWVRLTPWRDLVASFFDSALTRGHLDGVTALSIRAGGPATASGATAAAAYVAGWIGSRLGWRGAPGGPRRKDGRSVEVELTHDAELGPGEVAWVRIEARDGDPPASFFLERLSPYRPSVRLSVEIEGTCPLPRIQRLDPLDEVALLCGELERGAHDLVFEAALAEAAGFALGVR